MPVTWDPAHKDALITLSGSNLVATGSSGSGTVNTAVYATQAISPTIKQYFEVLATAASTPGTPVGQYYSIGVMNGAAALNSNIGAINGAAFVSSSGSFMFVNGTTFSSGLPALTNGAVMRVAIDRAANKIWWAQGNIAWDVGSGSIWMGDGAINNNPATGVGGRNVSAVTGTIYPAFSAAWTGDVANANFGATAFTYPVPAGFVGLDTAIHAGPIVTMIG